MEHCSHWLQDWKPQVLLVQVSENNEKWWKIVTEKERHFLFVFFSSCQGWKKGLLHWCTENETHWVIFYIQYLCLTLWLCVYQQQKQQLVFSDILTSWLLIFTLSWSQFQRSYPDLYRSRFPTPESEAAIFPERTQKLKPHLTFFTLKKKSLQPFQRSWSFRNWTKNTVRSPQIWQKTTVYRATVISM